MQSECNSLKCHKIGFNPMCMQRAENDKKVLQSCFIKLTISLLNYRKTGKWNRYNSLLAQHSLILGPLIAACKANKLICICILQIIIGITQIILATTEERVGKEQTIHLLTKLVCTTAMPTLINTGNYMYQFSSRATPAS